MFNLTTLSGLAMILVGIGAVCLAYFGWAPNTYLVFGGVFIFLGIAQLILYVRAKARFDRGDTNI